MVGKKSRFESYKRRHNGSLAEFNDQCEIEAVLDRLHERVHAAMEELDASETRDKDLLRVNMNAKRLLDDLPIEKPYESVLAIFAFLTGLDNRLGASI
jgi:hypothetical protein